MFQIWRFINNLTFPNKKTRKVCLVCLKTALYLISVVMKLLSFPMRERERTAQTEGIFQLSLIVLPETVHQYRELHFYEK